MGALQPMHLMIVAAVVLLVFGPKKLPQLARSIGESMRELKKTLSSVTGSEPVAMVKEIGQTVSDLKGELNPLSPPRPQAANTPAPTGKADVAARPPVNSDQGNPQT